MNEEAKRGRRHNGSDDGSCVSSGKPKRKPFRLSLNDDLLTYDIGDVIDDQVLIGADEDELLLSDDDLDKDVTKEEKQKLKNEAEEWVKSQIAEGKKPPIKPQEETKQRIEKREQTQQPTDTPEVIQTPLAVAKPVTNAPTKEEIPNPIIQDTTQLKNNEIIAPILQEPVIEKLAANAALPVDEAASSTQSESLHEVEVPTSSTRDVDIEQYSTVSNSTSSLLPTDSCASSVIQSSQESASLTLSHGEISDPREDFEDEREERTNIKITSERETFEHNNEHSPEKSMNRFIPHQKRNGAPLIRGHPMRGHPNPLFPRPPLRFPHHGQPFLQPQQPNINPFAPQHPSNALAPNAGHHGPMASPQLDPNNPHQRPRHPFGFRPGPMSGFRHPNPGNMFPQGPHDFQPNQGNGGYNHPYGGGPRNMFRPEGMPPGMRPGMRMQRPPLQGLPPHGIPGQGNFMNVPPMHIRPQVGPGLGQPGVTSLLPTPQAPSTGNAAPTQQMSAPIPTSSSAIATPRKVLINPNFKGGVEAATSKFIQDTQYMNAMNSGPHVPRVQSDEELLRQQEEFINKNREHIEKRRHARDVSPPTRRSRSRSRSRSPRSRSRSVSRERSYTPPKRHANGGPNSQNTNNRVGGADRFDRDRERDRERDRDRERERDRDRDRPLNSNNDSNIRMAVRGGSRDREERDRERNRPLGGYNNRGGNRFRRGNSRDRDYENRNQGGGVGGQYGKRRRSKSPSPANRAGGGNFANNRGRYNNDREKAEVDEDDETRAYRLQIEKQKALREQIMRDKEMKRRRAAEEKQYEDKRSGSGGGQPQQQKDESVQSQQHQPQKFKEIVPERKMISLKKRPAPPSGDNYADDHHSSSSSVSRKTIPTAKILPEAKKTLTEHLSNNATLSSSSGRDHHQTHTGGHSNNTAVIKPVLKKDTTVAAIRPQLQASSHHAPARRLSSRCEDEVQLDYDEDDLLLDEEDLLASEPEPTPPRENISKQRAMESRTPSPEPTAKSLSRRPMQSRGSGGGSSKQSLSSHNRRIVLKTSSNSLASAMSSSDRNRGSSNLSSGGSSSSISRRVILDRLDVRNSRQQSPNAGGGNSGGGSSSSDSKRKPQRIILKHD